jgi:hypothetical protein
MAELQGAHYKVFPGEQHHQRAIRLKLNWYAANITKYAERAPYKGQLVEDLIKVLDYTCMWLAHEGGLNTEHLDRIDSLIRKVVPPIAAIGPENYEPHAGARRNTEDK